MEDMLLEFDARVAEGCESNRSLQTRSDDYSIRKFDVDTAEYEPLKVWITDLGYRTSQVVLRRGPATTTQSLHARAADWNRHVCLSRLIQHEKFTNCRS